MNSQMNTIFVKRRQNAHLRLHFLSLQVTLETNVVGSKKVWACTVPNYYCIIILALIMTYVSKNAHDIECWKRILFIDREGKSGIAVKISFTTFQVLKNVPFIMLLNSIPYNKKFTISKSLWFPGLTIQSELLCSYLFAIPFKIFACWE
jgi:hypothetical protein